MAEVKAPANGADSSTAATASGSAASGSQASLKAIIKNVDMSEEMQQMAVDIAQDAMTKFTVEKDIAAHIKRTLDSKVGPTWHVVVGKNCESRACMRVLSFTSSVRS